MNKEQKKLIYKQAKVNGSKETLQSALERALRHHPKPSDRLEALGADGSDVRFVNYANKHQKMIIGVFHKVTRGKAQQMIEMTKDGQEWPITPVTAKATGKENREFIEGTLFFGIWRDHVILHQTVSLRSNHLEEHLAWLLSQTASDGGGSGVGKQILIALEDPLPPEVRKKSKTPARRVTFGGSLQAAILPSQQRPQTTSATKSAKVSFTPFGPMWDGLKKILAELKADVPDDLLLDHDLGEGDVKVSLELSCTKKKAETAAGDVLSALGNSIRHSEAVSYSVELSDGSKIRSEDMKVERHFSMECVDRNPVHTSLFARMVEYLSDLIESGVIIEKEPFGNT